MSSWFKEDQTANEMPQELDFCTAMDQLVFSKDTKVRMTQRLEQSAKASRRPWRAQRAAAAALAAVLAVSVLGIGAGAAGAFKPVTELFAPLFGGEESQLALIERLGTPMEVSVTEDGITVTAEAMLNDGENMSVLYSISRDDGKPLIPADLPEGGTLLFGAESGAGGWGFQRRSGSAFEYAPGKSAAQYLDHYALHEPWDHRLLIDLLDLEYWYEGQNGRSVVVPLSDQFAAWQFDLPVLENSCPVQELSGGYEEFESNGFLSAVTSVRVSPIAVKVTYELLDEDLAEKAKANATNGAEFDEVSYTMFENALLRDKSLILRKKDGTEIDLSFFDDGHGNLHPTAVWEYSEEADAVYGVCGTSLTEIIPLEDMDCVLFNGMEYPVNP